MIYVKSKRTSRIFQRMIPYNGTISGYEGQRDARIVVSEVRNINSNVSFNWIKSDLVKIKKDDYPEYFL